MVTSTYWHWHRG